MGQLTQFAVDSIRAVLAGKSSPVAYAVDGESKVKIKYNRMGIRFIDGAYEIALFNDNDMIRTIAANKHVGEGQVLFIDGLEGVQTIEIAD